MIGTLTDAEREQEIDAAYDMMLRADNPRTARTYFAHMCVLIRERSPEQIYAMESERRLTRGLSVPT